MQAVIEVGNSGYERGGHPAKRVTVHYPQFGIERMIIIDVDLPWSKRESFSDDCIRYRRIPVKYDTVS